MGFLGVYPQGFVIMRMGARFEFRRIARISAYEPVLLATRTRESPRMHGFACDCLRPGGNVYEVSFALLLAGIVFNIVGSIKTPSRQLVLSVRTPHIGGAVYDSPCSDVVRDVPVYAPCGTSGRSENYPTRRREALVYRYQGGLHERGSLGAR